MSTQSTPSPVDASSSAVATKPATMVIAGVLALALGGVGVAAFMSKKNAPAMTATESPEQAAAKAKAKADLAAADAAAQAALAGVPSKAALKVAPQEDPALGASGKTGTGASTGTSAFPENDPSVK